MAGLNSDQTPLAEIMPALQTSTTRTATVGYCRNAATKRIEKVAAGAHELRDLPIRGPNQWRFLCPRPEDAVSTKRATIERLAAFSDGIFSVIITIMVLDLRPPEHP